MSVNSVHTHTHTPGAQVRTIAAVLLRRIFLQLEYKELCDQVNNSVLVGCRAELLVAIQAEPSRPIRIKICDAVAELARSCIGGCGQNVAI